LTPFRRHWKATPQEAPAPTRRQMRPLSVTVWLIGLRVMTGTVHLTRVVVKLLPGPQSLNAMTRTM